MNNSIWKSLDNAPTELFAALGFRHPSLRWEDIEEHLQSLTGLPGLLEKLISAPDWPLGFSKGFAKLPNPRQAFLAAAEDLDRIADLGATCVTPLSPDYPENLNLLIEKPIVLSYMGSPFWQQHPTVSIVGSRNPRAETLRWLDSELPFVVRSGVTLVSGGARGIDQKVHSVAIRCESATAVVLPSGLGSLYPQDLHFWRDDVLAAGGAFVSEFAPQQEMRKHHFYQRNRLVAGFSAGTVIAQCGSKSGTWMTAMSALNNGRNLGVLPGSPLDAQFAGSLDLLFDGASPVRNAQDILSLLSRFETRQVKPIGDSMI